MNFSLLSQLLPLIEAYDKQASPDDVTDLSAFGYWLVAQTATPFPFRLPPSAHAPDEVVLSSLLIFLTRYTRGYARRALDDTPLSTLDDFTYLVGLLEGGPVTRASLVARNLHEKATGTEIIRRLLARGLVEESLHPTDGRSKLLALTPAGRALLFQVMGPMGDVTRLVAGNLTPAELVELVRLLSKLDAFHHPIFTTERAATLPELMRAHLPPTVTPTDPEEIN